MKKPYLRILYFFELWGSDYYGEPINADFAWELAAAFADYDDELSQWEEL